MKRWTVLSGRAGTVLLAIGLALLLISLIPSMGGQTSGSMGSYGISSRMWQTIFGQVMTPQQNLDFSVTANDTLNIYLFGVDSSTIYDWIREHHPELLGAFLDVTYLEEFLDANPSSVVWQTEIHNERVEHAYTPTKVTNATVAISNPNPNIVTIEYSTSVATSIAPTDKVKTLAILVIPIGFVLTIPWIVSLLRTKRRQ